MKRTWVVLLATVALACACAAVWYLGWKHYRALALKDKQMPYGWFRKGESYDVGVDNEIRHGGNASCYIRFVGGGSLPISNSLSDDDSQEDRDFGLLMQRFKADRYRGKTVRLSAYVRSQDAGEAALWMRVDGLQPGLRFDNMADRPIRGTTGWQRYEITLDVPDSSIQIYFGALLTGKGKVWVDDFRFETVGGEAPEAARATPPPPGDASLRPVDLDFEQ
jgi:hypothetical protein